MAKAVLTQFPKYTKITGPNESSKTGFMATTDHIFHNQSVTLYQTLDIPEDSLLFKEKALPNSLFPSDHIRLQAKYLIHE
jgi:mRNA deadenylase 3'-5' endonuclease subunit Ccr4